MSDEDRETTPSGPPEVSSEASQQEEAAGTGGASTEGAAAAPPAAIQTQVPEPAAPPPGPTPAAIQPAEVSNDDRLMAMLAWLTMVIVQLPVLSIVLLLIEPNKSRPFQRYHAVTSTIFWVVALIYEALAAIVFTVLSLISLGCLALCLWVIFFLPHLLALYYAYRSYNGKYMEIPFVSNLARGQGWV
jgi:uncharacterized membrane protein